MEGDLGRKCGRYTQEVAEYAERLQEVDERTRDAPLDVVERGLERVRASLMRQREPPLLLTTLAKREHLKQAGSSSL
jgi:hypothetical protein